MNMIFPEIYPDELVYSWLARYVVYSGYPMDSRLSLELFEKKINGMPKYFIGQFKSGMQEIIEKQYSINDLIFNHTMYPAYVHFMPLEKKKDFLRCLKNNNGGLANLLPITSKNGNKTYMQYCPLCVKEDRQKYGETYWHRIHQIPHVQYCLKHGCLLQDSSLGVTIKDCAFYIPAESIIGDDAPIFCSDINMNFFKYIKDVFNAPVNFYKDIPMNVIFLHALKDKNYILDTGKRVYRNNKRLLEKLNTYYSVYIAEKLTYSQIQPIITTGICFDFFKICQIAFFLKIPIQDLIDSQLTEEEVKEGMNITTKNENLQIDFETEDKRLLPAVKQTVHEIYHGTTDNNYQPGRVTERTVRLQVDLGDYRLPHMPLCRAAIQAYMESTDEFRARRAIWGYNQVKKQYPTKKIFWIDIAKSVYIHRKEKEFIIPYLYKHTDETTAKKIEQIILNSITK